MVKKVLNIEDTAFKHIAIKRALNKAGVLFVDEAATGDKGLAMIETSIAEGNPYDLVITDMHFPIYGEDDVQAGMKVIHELKRRGIEIPVVVCSSLRYNIPEVVECIFFNQKSRDIDADIREMLKKIK